MVLVASGDGLTGWVDLPRLEAWKLAAETGIVVVVVDVLDYRRKRVAG